jgi:predicted transporter
MDLNILLWTGGMLFSLGIFAVKVGLGLGCGQYKTKGIALTLIGYTALFMVIAWAAERLMQLTAPLLQQGPWMHTLSAGGLIVWGLAVIFMETRGKDSRQVVSRSGSRTAGLLLIAPCPVCLSAMTFTTWAALGVIKQPPLLLGLSLGLAFSLMVLLVTLVCNVRTARSLVPLGLAMIVVGLYFIGSLFLPAKIETARALFTAATNEGPAPLGQDGLGVLAFLIVLLLAGYLAGNKIRSLQ